MRNLKRVLSLALALVMVLGMMVITTSAADYTDADDITYTEAVDVMSAIGILKGELQADGTYAFNPTDTLTREGAAKILAFICLGTDADNYLSGSTADPFTDVKADRWSAKYVAYCKNLGIIDGLGDGSFNPKGNISTVGFGKLVLGAVGIDGTYTGAGWENNVKTALEDADLDVITIDNTDITREEACELALAAMKYSAESNSYNVIYNDPNNANDEDEIMETFDNSMDAALAVIALGGANAGYRSEKAPATGYLLNTAYNVTFVDGPDSLGRPSTTYSSNAWTASKVYADAAPVLTYTKAVSPSEIYNALGLKQATVAAWYINGFCQTGTTQNPGGTYLELAKADTTKSVGADGRVVEVYKIGNAITVVQFAYYLAEVGEVTEYEAATATTAEVDASSDLTIYGLVPTSATTSENGYTTIPTDEYEEGDLLVVTCKHDGTVLTYAPVETLENVAIEAYTKNDSSAITTITVAGETYPISVQYKTNGVKVDVTSDIMSDTKLEGTYNLYLDPNGYVLGTDVYTPATAILDYLFIDEFDAKAQGTSSLLTSANDAAVVAKVTYMDGTSEVLPFEVKTAKAPIANTTIAAGDKYVEINGTKIDMSGDTGNTNATSIKSWRGGVFAYSVDENGYLTITGTTTQTAGRTTYTAATSTAASFTSDAGVATIGGISGKYVNASTVLTIVDEDDKTTTYTGYANFPEIEANDLTGATVIYTAKNSTITKILVLAAPEVEVTATGTVALYLGEGNVTAAGQWYKFWIDGEVVSYQATSDGVTALGQLQNKKIATLTFVDGKVNAADAVSNNGTVALVEDEYFVDGNGVHYFDKDVKIFNVSENANVKWAADEIEVGDTVSFFTKTVGQATTVTYIFITTEANPT